MKYELKISDRLWDLVISAINQMEELELNEISVLTADNSMLLVSREPKDGNNLELIDVLEIKGGKVASSYILYLVDNHPQGE